MTTATRPTDQELLASFRGGDRAAAAELLGRYRTVMAWRIRRRGVPHQDVADVLAEAQLRALRYLDRAAVPGALLNLAADHAASNHLRRKPAPTLSPGELASEATAALRLDIGRALSRVGQPCIELLARVYACGLTHAEVADADGASRVTISRRVLRCLHRLRPLLEDYHR